MGRSSPVPVADQFENPVPRPTSGRFAAGGLVLSGPFDVVDDDNV